VGLLPFALPLPIPVCTAIYMRGQLKNTQWHYAHNNAQLCVHQGAKTPPQAFKHCLATMRARGRKQGSLGSYTMTLRSCTRGGRVLHGVGRAKNLGAWGVGKLMQLGFERGKKLCVRESVCVRDGVYAGKWTICYVCGGVMWKTMMCCCRKSLRWPDNH